MSWFGTLVNSLRVDDDESDAVSEPDVSDSPALRSDEGQSDRGGGVKEDLSEITKTLTRQLWGVASFFAPPPPQSPTEESTSGEADDRDGSESAAAAGLTGSGVISPRLVGGSGAGLRSSPAAPRLILTCRMPSKSMLWLLSDLYQSWPDLGLSFDRRV